MLQHRRSRGQFDVDTRPSSWRCSDMKRIAAGKFKEVCLEIIDDVARGKSPVVITNRGKPVAKLVPYVAPTPAQPLAGSIVWEEGDPFSTGETWF